MNVRRRGDKRQDLILVVRGVVSVLAEDEDEASLPPYFANKAYIIRTLCI